MMSAAPRQLRTGLALPLVFALVALVTFIGLGTWQLQRKAWKEALIATLEQRLAASPAELPPRGRWPSLDPSDDEFRRVKFSAALLPGQEALVYGSGSALRSDVSGPGYWVFAPARLAGGGLVVVNRGFVPEGRQDPKSRSAGDVGGTIEMIGVMRWPEPRGLVHREGRCRDAISGSCATSSRSPPPRAGARSHPSMSSSRARSRRAACRARARSRSSCATCTCNTRSPGTASLRSWW